MLVLTLVAALLVTLSSFASASPDNITEHDVVTGPESYWHSHQITDDNANYTLTYFDRAWRHSSDWLYFYRTRVYGGTNRVIRGTPRWQEHVTVDSVRQTSIRSEHAYNQFVVDHSWLEGRIDAYRASDCPGYCVYTEQWTRSGNIWTRYFGINYYWNY